MAKADDFHFFCELINFCGLRRELFETRENAVYCLSERRTGIYGAVNVLLYRVVDAEQQILLDYKRSHQLFHDEDQ